MILFLLLLILVLSVLVPWLQLVDAVVAFVVVTSTTVITTISIIIVIPMVSARILVATHDLFLCKCPHLFLPLACLRSGTRMLAVAHMEPSV